mmetsp:Transcript_35356/g.82640  ORF Transcript_35356/g.82640 Transcript_35356/m.82640 type:complete len:432 (-) Transcript_35356:219-1514(-)
MAPDAGSGEESEEVQEVAGEEAPEADDPVDADGWTDVFSGKIKVRQVSEGSGRVPEVKQDVVCTFEVRTFEDASSEAPLQVCKDLRVRIGEGDCPPGVELCLRRMKEGEVCEVFSVSNMAWGPGGRPAILAGEQEVPGDVDLHFRVTLHKCVDPDGSFQSGTDEMVWRKSAGTDYFRRKDFQRARRAYRAALEVFKNMGLPPEDMEDREGAAAFVDSLAADCNSNLAAVHLELGDTSLAKDAATKALEVSPDHPKALYRAAKACFLLHEHKECELALKRLKELQPEDVAVRKLYAELRQAQKEYAAKSKKLAAKLWEAPRDGYREDEEQKEKTDKEDERSDGADDEDEPSPEDELEDAEERAEAKMTVTRMATAIMAVVCGSLAIALYVVWVMRKRKFGMQVPLLIAIGLLGLISILCIAKEIIPRKVKAD